MFATGGTDTGFVGLAVALSTIETLVEKGVLSKADTESIIVNARKGLAAYGNTVNISMALRTIDEHLLPRFRDKS